MSIQVVATTGGVAGTPIGNERLSSTAVLPGHLLAESGGKVGVHAVAGGYAQKLFAGKKAMVAGDIDTAYAIGETVNYGAYHSGQTVSALVAPAAVALVDGDQLESAGDGTVKKHASGVIVGSVIGNVDNSAGATVARVNIRVA